ncbi:MAG: hypothetical protein K0Q73_8347 [Paenibacillus sp.]|jgi:very-short-patch-repair endonuclease|nr:hypothetical protein [Paenibacillus sp.]
MAIHPNLHAFIEKFEREAVLKGLYRNKLGTTEYNFLLKVWGPAFQHNFDGLHAEYPLKDFKGGVRFADFVYIRNGIKLLIEIDGFTTHARNISPGDFDDHLARQNDLILSGWLILRFSANQAEKDPYICQRQIKQAIGHWWSLTQGTLTADDTNIWMLRKQYLIHLAHRHNGRIRPADVSEAFRISSATSSSWLKRFTEEGHFQPIKQAARVTHYALIDYIDS